jgi:hypothetical protein
MTLAFDASVAGTNSAATLTLPALTTAQSNEIILLQADGNADHLTAPSSSPALTWNQIYLAGSGPPPIGAWWALAATAQAYTIAVNQNAATFLAACAFAVQGANTSTPLDSDSPVYSASDPITLSTASPNTMIVGMFRDNASTGSAGSGFTLVSGANFSITEYQIVSSQQTNLSITIGTGAGTANGAIAFAIVAGAGGGGGGIPAVLCLGMPKRIYRRHHEPGRVPRRFDVPRNNPRPMGWSPKLVLPSRKELLLPRRKLLLAA